jgi:selenocysteine lyase/cysteine desulfurase
MERRGFLQALGAIAPLGALPAPLLAALAEAPPRRAARLVERFLCGAEPATPDDSLFARDPEAYWAQVRRQFTFEPGYVYLNNGTIGSMPLPVLRAFFEAALTDARLEVTHDDPEEYPLWGYGPWNQYRAPVAQLVNCAVEELALTRNATEGLSCVANGLDLSAGDEVLTTDQEHPSGISPWLLRARRHGVVVKQVALPLPPTSDDDLVERFEAQRTPRTRVLFFSHITSPTGTVLPAARLCAWGRAHGLLTEVDGAHAVGQLPVDVKAIGCDVYVSSPHKWLLAPPGCGLLYVRDEVIDRIWSTMATGGWDDRSLRAARFQQFGSTGAALLAGLAAAVEYRRALGTERVERRLRELHAYLKGQVRAVPGAEVRSAPGADYTAALLCVDFAALDRPALQRWMAARHRIRVRGTAPQRLRLSPHIYHSRADLDRFVAAMAEWQGRPRTA